MLTTYAGYTFSSFVAFVCFFFIYHGQINGLFYAMSMLALINLVLWVRNFFGLIWLVLFLGLFLGIEYYQLTLLKEITVLLFSSILLVESVVASFTILILSFTKPDQAGDAKGLQKLTFIPAFMWGTLFFAQSTVACYLIFTLFLK